ALPLDLDFSRSSHDQGLAQHFRERVRSYMADWVKNNVKPDGSKYNIYTDGLRIYTTVDSRMQRYAEEAVREHLSNLQKVFRKVDGHRSTFPYYFETNAEAQVRNILNSAMRQSIRYKMLKKAGVSDD